MSSHAHCILAERLLCLKAWPFFPFLLLFKLVYHLPGFCMSFLYIHHLFYMLTDSREYTYLNKEIALLFYFER